MLQATLSRGDFVGPYEVQGFLGQGGMGQVYKAFDPRLERTIALKVITIPEGAANASDLSARLLREARAVARLSDPNVVAIYDVGESNGRPYLAMEYVVGTSLRNLVSDPAVPLARRVRWLVDVARALDAAHRAGIIHRDVKPENVMVREDGGIKVLDFGIARRTVATTDPQAVDTVTGGGAISGTPVYMAPEQIRGGDIDARCDQFGWGVMAYELVAGERPWAESGDVLSLVAKILTEPPRPLKLRVSAVPAVVEETILRALAKDAAARFPSMGDVADALEPFASVRTGPDRVRVTPRPTDDNDPAYAATTRVPTTVSVDAQAAIETAKTAVPKKSRALALAAPLALLGALAGAVYLVRSRPGPPPPSLPGTPRPLSTVPQAEAAYKDAMSLWHDGATAKARAAMKQAIELDPTFAAAHLELALQYASSNDPVSSQAAFQSAYEHRRMLVARDEELLESSEPYIRAKPDVEEWVTRMTSAVFQYPHDPELQFYLGRARQQAGEHEAAKTAFEAATRLDEGFIPALAAIAKSDRSLGKIADGLAITDRCLKRSPVAATCVETRYELLFEAGECTRAKDEATRWGSLEPQSPRPFASLARALYAEGAPRPSIEEVLARRWSLIPADDRKQAETWDRALLAVIDGDFARADELAREYEAGLSHGADAYDHAEPLRLRVNVLMEIDRMKEAAKAAHGFLDRMAAWAVYPFAPDPSLAFVEPLYRAGEIGKRELDARRADWLTREDQRTHEGRSASDPWATWATVYGSFAETREEAAEALLRMPAESGAADKHRGLFIDFAVGKVYALATRWDDALPYLQRVAGSCATFDAIIVIAKARYFLGQAQEAKGDAAAAKVTYSKITELWPKGTPARTAKRAAERLAALR